MHSHKEILLGDISKFLGNIGNHFLTLRNPENTPELIIWSPPKDGFCLLHCVEILYHMLREKDMFLFDEAFNGNGSLFEKMPLNLSDIKQIVNISAIKSSSEFTEECKTEISKISEESIGDLNNVILQVFNSIPSLIIGDITWLENHLQCFQGHFYLVLREQDEIEIFNKFITKELNILQQMNKKSDELKKVLEENLKQFSTVFDIPFIEEYQEILNAYSSYDILTQESKQRSLTEDEAVQLAFLYNYLNDKAPKEDVEIILKSL